MGPPDTIAPLTTEHHYTEPIETEHTHFGIDRFHHQVPLDWFFGISAEIDARTYEFFLKNKNILEMGQSVVTADFDYGVERTPDGIGKPFHITFCDSNGTGKKCYSRTHYLIRLLGYEEDIYEVVAVDPTDEHDGVLVAIHKRLPPVADPRVDSLEDTDVP